MPAGTGWLFWFAVTLSFAWSYYAVGRHLKGASAWRALAFGLALVAAAVDLVGVIINMSVLPEIAHSLTAADYAAASGLDVLFASMEKLAYGLTNVTAFGLYSMAGAV